MQTVRNLIAAPAVLALAYADGVVTAVAAYAAGWSLTYALAPQLGLLLAVLAATPLMILTVSVTARLVTETLPGRSRPLLDVCSEAAHRVADWAGWPADYGDDTTNDLH